MEAVGKMHCPELGNADADCLFLHDYGKTANLSLTRMVLCFCTSIRDGHSGGVFAVHPALSKLLIGRVLL